MLRRKFIKYTGWLSVIGSTISNTENRAMVKDMKKIKRGDKIGLITPASNIEEDRIQVAIAQVKSLGFIPVEGNHIREKYGYLAGTDHQRLQDLHKMYADPEIKAIWCIRGGYGCTRLLPYIDFDLIKKNPKPLIGYSDITALHISILQECNQVSFHGPNAGPEMNAYSLDYFNKVFFESNRSLSVSNVEDSSDYDEVVTINPGKAKGKLTGGNLSLIAAMTGTRWQMKGKKKIVCLEDIGEDTYRIDRMLTQVIQSGALDSARGLMLGQFKNCHPKNPSRSLSLVECLKDRLVPLGIPAVYGMSYGHIKHNFTLPIGAEARIDTAQAQLEIDLSFWD